MKTNIKPFGKISLLLSSILLAACGSDDNSTSASSNSNFSNSANTTVMAVSGEVVGVPIQKNVQIIPENITATAYIETVYEENAEKLKLVFDNIKLPEGTYVEIIDSDNQSQIYKLADTLASGVIVKGDSATIRVVLPDVNANASLGLKYITVEQKRLKREPRILVGTDDRRPLECFAGTSIYDRSLAAANARFGGWGSGAIVGNGRYMLTNSHVVGHEVPQNANVNGYLLLGWFNESCDSERQLEVNSIPLRTDNVAVTGGAGGNNDYALVRLNEFDVQHSGALTVFGSMRIRTEGENKVGDEIYIPQYGNGGVQPMVIGDRHENENAKIIKLQEGRIRYNVDTQSGSSGSPVISRQLNEIIGVHWGTSASGGNDAVALTTLQNNVLPVFANNNTSVIGQGKFKGNQLIIPPFELTEGYEPLHLPDNSLVTPFGGITITHHGRYSEVELDSQNVANDNNVIKLRYRLALKSSSGERDLSAPTTDSNILLIWRVSGESNQNSETKFISWLPLRVSNAQGNLVQNRILHLTQSKYDPYTSPFDINASDTIKTDLVISDASKNATVSQLNEGAQYSYIAAYTGEGPTVLDSKKEPGFATIYVPIKRADGQEVVVKLRGYRSTDCGSRAMNYSVGCASGQKSTFRVDYVPSDNPDLAKGTYTGILPVFAQAKDAKKNILVNIKLTQP